MKNNHLKKITKKYAKKIKNITRLTISSTSIEIEPLVEYLSFLRDSAILTEDLVNAEGEENLKISLLTVIVNEYSQYKNCINNYYNIKGNMITPKSMESSIDISKRYNMEKSTHWENFWTTLKVFLEGWSSDVKF